MHFQPIYDIAEVCSQKGLSNAVVCPGSRCAPLTLAFTRHKKIKARTFSDERSAGFVALGMAQQTRTPSILLCTSGTAVYNFAPAVAEAFFSQTPLIVFTADRPQEWIAQYDGQTIYQPEIFGKHVKKSFSLPQDFSHADDHWAVHRIINEAINLATEEPRGPVHINAPFREPFYPAHNEKFDFSENVRVIVEVRDYSLSGETQNNLLDELSRFERVLIVAGQQDYHEGLLASLEQVNQSYGFPVVGDIISNVHPLGRAIRHADVFLGQAPENIKQKLQPDLLITFGKSVVSKHLKLFLRKPKTHWHIQPGGTVADPFQHVSKAVRTTPENFFDFLKSQKKSGPLAAQQAYAKHWENEEQKAVRSLEEFFPLDASNELEVVRQVLSELPGTCNLHLANSMSVRYANFMGLTAHQKGVRVYGNRGTSGIDGCTSTVVGHCLESRDLNVLITGDLAFFYDRNAFWHNYQLPNLRVILLNNHGGIIFKLIDGPAALPESDEFFVTNQKLNGRSLCEEFGFGYQKIEEKKIKDTVPEFFKPGGPPKILELESSIEWNKTVFENLKKKIKHSYET